MATLGVCAYCSAPAMRTCRTCGSITCGLHTDPRTSVCVTCTKKGDRRVPPGSREL